jgi:hypothetical protein
VCGGQPSPHRPRLVVSHSTCPPLSSSPHAHNFGLGTTVINKHTHVNSFVLGPAVMNTRTKLFATQTASLVCGGQPSPHKPLLVVSHSTCPPLSFSPHAHSFVLGPAVGNKHNNTTAFLRLLFLLAHRETEAHFTAAGMPSQRNQSESLRFKRAAFYQGLKSKVGLAAAKAAALRINLNVQVCSNKSADR